MSRREVGIVGSPIDGKFNSVLSLVVRIEVDGAPIPELADKAISGGAGERTWRSPYAIPTPRPMRRETR
jgi:hypothetical protein